MPANPEARCDLVSGLGLAVLAVAYLVANGRYPLDTLATPGPGVFPLAAGVLALTLGVSQAVRAMGAYRDAARVEDEDSPRFPLAMVVVLVAWVVVMPIVGFLPTSFVVVLVSSRLMGASGWGRPAALALVVSAATYVLFVRSLGVPLPAGLFR